MSAATEAQAAAAEAFDAAEMAQEEAVALAEATEEALANAEEARAEVQSREADARAERSSAEGEANALRAEVAALGAVGRTRSCGGNAGAGQVQVEPGYEAALGAALADDLRAPAIEAAGKSGWAGLPDYDDEQALPEGVPRLSRLGARCPMSCAAGSARSVWWIAQRARPCRLTLRPGQRLVSIEGDLVALGRVSRRGR